MASPCLGVKIPQPHTKRLCAFAQERITLNRARKHNERLTTLREDEIGKIIADNVVHLRMELDPGLLESAYEALLARRFSAAVMKNDIYRVINGKLACHQTAFFHDPLVFARGSTLPSGTPRLRMI